MLSGAQRASHRGLPRHLVLILVLACIAAGGALGAPSQVAAATGPKVAIIVGPAGSRTAQNRAWANAAAAEALRHTPNVVKVYSPRATWSRVKAAISGASIVVYIGRGYGSPTAASSTLNTSVQDGFSLNPVSGVNDSTTKRYGEAYIRAVRLAPHAVVLLSHLSYASGNGEPGQSQPTLAVARRRVANYGAGFLAAGASAVIAEAAYPPAYYIRAILTRTTSLDAIWKNAPTRHGHVTSFRSSRTSGAVGRTDPVRVGTGYYRSIVGWPSTSTATVRRGHAAGGASKPAGAAVTVPSSINATCGSGVSAALNAWIKAQPNGSTLVFPSGSCYQLNGDAGLNLANRSNLTLVGTGSRLQLRTTGASNFSSAFFLQNSTHITIRGFAVDGGNTATGTTSAGSQVNERMDGANIRAGSSFIEFDHVSWDRLRGFGIFISSDGGTAWPTDISIHDSTIRGGEMGVAIVAGRRIQIVHNTINDSVWYPVDMEPDSGAAGPNGEPGDGGGFIDVLISDNDVTRYGWGQTMTSWFVAFCPADEVVGSAVMDGLTITGNRVHVGAATSNNGNYDGIGGLAIRGDKANLKRNIVITDNWTADDDTRSGGAVVVSLANVQNLTVTGNRQPIANGDVFVLDIGTSGTRIVGANDVSP